MKARIVVITACLLLLGMVTTTQAWEAPLECADSEREIPGNRSTPCKLVLPEVKSVEYRFTMEYPYCYEEMALYMPGIGEPVGTEFGTDYWHVDVDFGQRDTQNPDGFDALFIEDYMLIRPGDRDFDFEYTRLTLDSHVRTYGYFENEGDLIVLLQIPSVTSADDVYSPYDTYELIFEIPNPGTFSSRVELANACIALLKQEEEARKQQAKLAEEQAEREAEAQSLNAKLELQAAVESRLRVTRTELRKTETLVAQLEHEKLVGEILRDIVRIKLTGEEDRAKITNEYLEGIAAVLSDFDEESSAIEASIKRYVGFNDLLLDRIEQYYANVSSRIDLANEIMAAQRERMEQMEQQAEDIRQSIEEAVPQEAQ